MKTLVFFATVAVVVTIGSTAAKTNPFCEQKLCVNFNCSDYDDPKTNTEKVKFIAYNITALDRALVQCFPNAREFVASDTNITSIDPMFFNTVNDLQHMCLEFNPLEVLEGGIFIHAGNLTNLNLSNNFITTIHAEAFQGLQALVSLSLAHNLIASVDFKLFVGLNNLSHLNLRSNRLQVITLSPLSELEVRISLDLSHNRIASITSDRKIKLTALDVSDNVIMDITVLNHIESLKHLNLSYNRDLIVLSTTFKKVGHGLETLVLDGIDLGQWEQKAVLQPLESLRHLYIANASLSCLCLKNFPVLPKLEELHVHDNPDREMKTDRIKQVCPALKKLVIGNDGWNCNFLELMVYRLESENITVLPNRVTSLKPDNDYKEFRGIRCKRASNCASTEQPNLLVIGFWILLATTVALIGYSVWTSVVLFCCRRKNDYTTMGDYNSLSMQSNMKWMKCKPADEPYTDIPIVESGYTARTDDDKFSTLPTEKITCQSLQRSMTDSGVEWNSSKKTIRRSQSLEDKSEKVVQFVKETKGDGPAPANASITIGQNQ